MSQGLPRLPIIPNPWPAEIDYQPGHDWALAPYKFVAMTQWKRRLRWWLLTFADVECAVCADGIDSGGRNLVLDPASINGTWYLDTSTWQIFHSDKTTLWKPPVDYYFLDCSGVDFTRTELTDASWFSPGELGVGIEFYLLAESFEFIPFFISDGPLRVGVPAANYLTEYAQLYQNPVRNGTLTFRPEITPPYTPPAP